MRQAVSTSTIFKAILAFTFLFSGFLAIAIVYNKAYKMKNEAISILEKYEGTNDTSIKIINNYLKNNGYSTKGKCNSANEYGIKDLNDNSFEKAQGNTEYYYCISYNCTNDVCNINSGGKIYYHYRLFFKFNLPFFGELFTFDVTGESKGIKLYSDKQILNS